MRRPRTISLNKSDVPKQRICLWSRFVSCRFGVSSSRFGHLYNLFQNLLPVISKIITSHRQIAGVAKRSTDLSLFSPFCVSHSCFSRHYHNITPLPFLSNTPSITDNMNRFVLIFLWYSVALLACIQGATAQNDESAMLSDVPSMVPSDMPSMVPSIAPTRSPTKSPSLGSDYPSIVPTGWGTPKPTGATEVWASDETRRLAQRISSQRERRMNYVRMR